MKTVSSFFAFVICLVAFFVSVPAYAKRTVYVHLFEWRWADIARECETVLGPAGYAAVQISPPQEHAILPGNPWYQRYQPVSYQIQSRSGTRAEFADMVRRCRAAGVEIYADAVINHMTWVNRSGQWRGGSAGSQYGEYKYPGTFEPWDFHRCGRNGDVTQNYHDRWEVQNCNLGVYNQDCADLKTESDYVQGRIAGYLNDLLSLGVAGFRIDAAKHIPAGDIHSILRRLSRLTYVFSEVIDFGGEPIGAGEYFGFGDVTEFRYGRELARVFKHGKLAWLSNFGEAWGFVPSDQAMVFVDTHDTQRGHGAGGEVLTHKDGWQNQYVLANVFMLAWPYGYPQVMSSYRFSNGDAGPPSDSQGRTRPVFDRSGRSQCFGDWVCEHRWDAIARMVGFRNFTDTAFRVTKWWTDGGNRIAFGRGGRGYVMINRTDNGFRQWLDTGLPSGRYCDVISGRRAGGVCTGKTVTVNQDGWAEFDVASNDAVAIHGGERL